MIVYKRVHVCVKIWLWNETRHKNKIHQYNSYPEKKGELEKNILTLIF